VAVWWREASPPRSMNASLQLPPIADRCLLAVGSSRPRKWLDRAPHRCAHPMPIGHILRYFVSIGHQSDPKGAVTILLLSSALEERFPKERNFP
jgi:hypothetical protein